MPTLKLYPVRAAFPILLGLAILAGSPFSAAATTAQSGEQGGAAAETARPAEPVSAGSLLQEMARATEEEGKPLDMEQPQPPDGVWKVDENGKEYFVEPMRRYEGKYKWISETRIKYLGVPIDIVDHDDDWFYVKIYRADNSTPKSFKKLEITPELLETIRAHYAVDIPEVDRVQLRPFDKGLPKSGQWRNGFEIADMNADGKLDIVHCPPRKGRSWPAIFLGDGEGNWKLWEEARFPAQYDYGDVAVGDFNGDGNKDLALGIHLRGVKVLVGDGKGGFSEWSEGVDYQVPGSPNASAEGFSSRSLVAADWNGDGRDDILALGEGPRNVPRSNARGVQGDLFIADGMVIFLNQGDGTWKRLQKGSDEHQLFGDDIATGDFNGDGKMDFATGSSRMGRTDLVNLATGNGDWQPVPLDVLHQNIYVRTVTAADFDADGRSDLAIGYVSFDQALWYTGIDVLYSRADGEWERKGLFSREGRVAVYALEHGDLDGDGALDLVGLDGDGQAVLFLGDGKGFFRQQLIPEDQQQARGDCRAYHVELADLDGDGRSEIVAGFAGEANALFTPDRCPSGGGLAAWKIALEPVGNAKAAAQPGS